MDSCEEGLSLTFLASRNSLVLERFRIRLLNLQIVHDCVKLCHDGTINTDLPLKLVDLSLLTGQLCLDIELQATNLLLNVIAFGFDDLLQLRKVLANFLVPFGLLADA